MTCAPSLFLPTLGADVIWLGGLVRFHDETRVTSRFFAEAVVRYD